MKIAAGHESKHKAAMSKAGDVVEVISISTGQCVCAGQKMRFSTEQKNVAKQSGGLATLN